MIEIKDLLLRFDKIIVSSGAQKQAISEVLFQTVGIKVGSKDIKIKNNILYLDIKPIYKSEIFLKKNIINCKLRETLGKKAPEEIR